MRCASCGSDNPEGAKFCIECATSFPRCCPRCGTGNPPQAKFCAECATPLTGESSVQRLESKDPSSAPSLQDPDASRPTLHAPRVEAERRQLTVMFCDLVGSTSLSEQLDPEELREVVRAYQETCTEVIQRYDGHIAQHLGDGLLVYFGYPQAHEDDAARAVRAGLEIVTAVQSLLPERSRLQVRIGIHTGLVVIGEIGSSEKREILALGETPNLAARLQGLAEPDTVVISAATQRLVTGLFESHDLGPQTLKGISSPLSVYQVVGESTAQSRFDAALQTGLTPLVGRAEELALLQRRWAQAKAGEGQVVLLSGEPGIGKSRLVQEFKEQLGHEGAPRIEFRCSPYHQNSALYPIIEHLQRLLQFAREDAPEEKLRKLVQVLGRRVEAQRLPEQSSDRVIASAAKQSLQGTEIASSPEFILSRVEGAPRTDNTRLLGRQVQDSHRALQEVVPLLAALLSLPHPEGYLPITVSPQKQKEKTQAALVAWLVEEAEQKTVHTIWEDLHWADPSTLEVLTLFLDQVPTTRLLVLLTFRPEFTPPWKSRSHMSHLTPGRLSRAQVREMVSYVTDQAIRLLRPGSGQASTSSGRTEAESDGERLPVRAEPVEARTALPNDLIDAVVARTDGVPLFVEELTKSVVETVGAHGRAPLQSLDIPATLQDSLMARLDRLGAAKEIAQVGAVLGREFSYELLHAVFPSDEVMLQQGLRQLVEAELIYQRGLPPQATYLFKHALIQDTAYQSLLKSTRQQYHRQIANVLEERFSETKETQPELLAHHYTEASLIAQAIPYWQRAGQRASQRSAHQEAVNHLTKGLELLKALPDTPERAQQELTLQIALGPALMATKGWAAPEVQQVYTRARELCRQIGETPELFPVLRGLQVFYFVRAEHRTSYELGEQLLTLAPRLQNSTLLVGAHLALGQTLFFQGELALARDHLEQGMALYDPRQDQFPAWAGGHPGVQCLLYRARTLWFLGYQDQAVQRSGEAFALAQGLSHPFSLAFALLFSGSVHRFRRETQIVRERAEVLVRLAGEHGFPFWLGHGRGMLGWTLVEQEQEEQGIAQMRQGLADLLAIGAALNRPFDLANLAEAYGRVGRTQDALNMLTEALDIANRTGERFYEAEIYRLKGQLTLQKFQVPSFEFQVPPNPQPLTPSTQAEAEACFHKAIEVARHQQAKSLELRAATSCARLWQQQGKQKEAHAMLAEIYNWFTEGLDTKDLQEAKALLDELS